MNVLVRRTQFAWANSTDRQCGFSLIEVLISAVILAIGLLGLASLQAMMVASELDAYQRSHALVLLQDMMGRINTSRTEFENWADANPNVILTAGTDDARDIADSCADITSIFDRALCEWSQELKGASATLNEENIGAMIGARGCIERIGTDLPLRLQVSVAWQGLTRTAAPDENLTCGLNAFGADQEDLRRVVTAIVVIPSLTN